ncbi:MAG: mannose-1-phosphate guanylyltransferase [Blastocatellia bacterium]|jgi:NDP-sugar pyrophosphorylase family protein|nr:mannose-1-phosphate guanylyltransferase [Blastocatellia bacterium]
MQALILAGGKGTRLRPLTVYTPKPIVPICNRPFLLYQIDTLRRAGITDITLSLSYQPNKIEQQLGDGSDFGVNLKYTVEPQPMGTAGAYKYAEELIREPTVVFNGDILTDLDLKAVIREHNERQATATIVLTPVENPSAYGLVETEEDGRVRRFLEKPKPEEITSNNINAGTYILEPRVLDYIPAGENHSFEYGLFPTLLMSKEQFFAHIPQRTYWMDIGTPARYLQTHDDLLADRVGRMRLKERRGNFDAATVAEIDDLSMIGDDCTLKPGAQIVNSVLGPGCFVEEKARVENSVVWAHTRIGAGAQVSGAIVGRGCHIGRACQVGPGTVLGDKASLTDYTLTGGATA